MKTPEIKKTIKNSGRPAWRAKYPKIKFFSNPFELKLPSRFEGRRWIRVAVTEQDYRAWQKFYLDYKVMNKKLADEKLEASKILERVKNLMNFFPAHPLLERAYLELDKIAFCKEIDLRKK